jgi:preprotein translocase subunit YajC
MFSIVFMLGIMLVMYFFMIRPQMQRQKKERIFREGLKKGDSVMTIGGIHGRIVTLEDKTALIEIDKDVKIRVEKVALRPLGDIPNVGQTGN